MEEKLSPQNTVFRLDSYPDIQKNELDDGTIIPAEVEWNTSNFDRHGHDISVLIDNNGFDCPRER